MSWQEKIERYKQEQAQTQSEAERKLGEEQERQRLANVEKIKPLLQALKDLRCREMLTQIRDEVWKLGEVTVETHNTPIEAEIILEAKWPRREYAQHWADSGGGDFIYTHQEKLEIVAKYGIPKENIIIGFGVGWPGVGGDELIWVTLDEETRFWLEQRLIEDCAKRGGSFDEAAKNAANEIKDIPRRDLENWYSANWKMLGFWEKLRWILRDK